MLKRWTKFFALPHRDRLLLVTTFGVLVFVRLTLSFLPFRVVRQIPTRLQTPWLRYIAGNPERLIWAVTATARHVPGATCLTQALTAQMLYGSQGISAITRFGVLRGESGRLEAHAWLEAGGKIVLGASEPGKFTPLTER